jgi:hypothetical protein
MAPSGSTQVASEARHGPNRRGWALDLAGSPSGGRQGKLIDRFARSCPNPTIFFWFSFNPPILLRPEIFPPLRGARNAQAIRF